MKGNTIMRLILIGVIVATNHVFAQDINQIKSTTNTRKGNLTLELYIPQKFIQIGGMTTTDQNDLNFRGTLEVTEYDSYSHISYVYKSSRLSPKATLNYAQGVSLTRKKGGLDGELADLLHFGWGMTTVGYLHGIEYEFLLCRGIYFYSSTNMSVGISFSDFGDKIKSDWLLIPISCGNYCQWGNRGFGATIHEEIGFKFAPKIGKHNSSEIVQFNVYYNLTAHAFWLLPFYSYGRQFSNISAVYFGMQKTLTIFGVGISFDILKNK